MSHELHRMYAVLASDIDATPLDPPESLRRRSDRRARMVTAGVCILVAAAVVGSSLFGRALLTSTPTLVGDTPTPPATSSPDGPTPSPAGVIPRLPIPDNAFINLSADMHRPDSSPQDVEGVDWMPKLCDAAFPLPASIERRTRMIYYSVPPVIPDSTPTGTVHQLLAVSEQAGAYMSGLRSLVGDGCVSEEGTAPGTSTTTSRVLPAPVRGDDSLLIEMHWSSTIEECCPPNPDFIYYVSVTRVGTVISLIVVRGWEGSTVDRADADLLTDRALTSVQGWLR